MHPQLRAVLGPTMTGCVVSSLLVFFACFVAIHADPTISTFTPTPCYGDVVTLVCQHPEVASNPGRYLATGPLWRENGVGITPSTGVYLQADTSEDLTHTTLPINITVNHFRNRSFNYSCLLVLAENGLPTGEVEPSENVTVDPVDPRPPFISEVVSNENNITTMGSYSSGECYSQEDSQFEYNITLSVNNMNQGSTNVPSLNYTFPASRGENYTISVTAIVTVSGLQLKSQPFSFSVIAGEPSTMCQNMTSRYNEPFVLTCNITTGIEPDKWTINGSKIEESDRNYTMDGSKLNIQNVEAAIFWNRATRFECSVSEDGVTFTGSPYMLDPVEILFVPNVLSNSSTQATISITWEDLSVYFNSTLLRYIVCWRVNGTDKWFHSTPEEVRTPYFTISDLNSNTPYEILLTVSNNSVSVNRTFILSTLAAIPPTGPVNTIAIGVGAAIGVVTILTCAVVIILTACTCVILKYRISRRFNTIFIAKPRCESVSHDTLERGFCLQEGVRSIKGQPQMASQRTGRYADLDFTDDRPGPAPSQEKVTYTEVGTKPIKDVDTSPGLPPKQDRQQIKAFRDNVKAVLGVICQNLEETIEKKGMKKENAFTAKFNGINFVVTCVYTSSDLNINHVYMATEAKHLTWAKVGLLISNQSTIPSECLQKLEDAGCDFVPVSGYGEKGWEDRMIGKFKFVFSEIANKVSKSEDLPISVQVVDSSPKVLPKCPPPPMTTPPPDYQNDNSGVTSDDSKTHDGQFRSPPTTTIVSGQYSMYMPPITSGLFMSSFEYKLSDEEEVLHKRVPWEELMEEEALPVPVQETPLTTCPPPSTAASIANLEYPGGPLPTAASVASGECPEILLMALTESSHEYPDVLKADDSNISPEQTSVSDNLPTSEQVVDSSPMIQPKCPSPPTSPPPDDNSEPPADPFRSQPHGDVDHTQVGPVVDCFTSIFDYTLEDDDTVPLIEWECV